MSNEIIITDLEPKKQRFIHLFLTGQYTNKKIAELLEVHPNTVTKWLKNPTIESIIKEEQEAEHMVVSHALKSLTLPAIEKLRKLVNSPIDGVALNAVKDILDRGGHKPKQEIKKDVAIVSYEQQLSSLIDATIVDAEVIE